MEADVKRYIDAEIARLEKKIMAKIKEEKKDSKKSEAK
jgi:hypothetical protein